MNTTLSLEYAQPVYSSNGDDDDGGGGGDGDTVYLYVVRYCNVVQEEEDAKLSWIPRYCFVSKLSSREEGMSVIFTY